MSAEIRPAHSPLGASGAERWMNCPGSVTLLKELDLPESDEPDYRQLGTHAHALAAECLETNTDAWEHAGQLIEGIEVSVETCNAVQVFLDECRSIIPTDGTPYTVFIEKGFTSPVHPLFYGTTDFAVVCGKRVSVRDYKHGEGIAVDVEENPQVRYYGYGIIQDLGEVEEIDYAIVQPRGFHPDGVIRRWGESAASLRSWVSETLVPAMLLTEQDHGLSAGDWCRFCPAKLVCPLLTDLFKAACLADPKQVVTLRDEQVFLNYNYIKGVKFYIKALEDHTFNRLNAGADGTGVVKLVNKKADRVWKPEASVLFKSRFGDDAFTKPELKSPAQMSEISPVAKELVKEYAFTPESGLTVAPWSDKRGAVAPQSAAAKFGTILAGAVDAGTPG